MKFFNKLQKFMYSRYGVDALYKFLFKICIILFVLDLFINSNLINFLELIIITIMLFRFFSKNIYARARENQRFLKIKSKLLKPFKNINRNLKDKNHVYKKCHKCKKILKLPLPSKRGVKHAKCPHCGKRIKIFTWKYQKVEFIK